MPFVETNMSSNDMIGLAKDFSNLVSKGLQQDRFPRDEQAVGQTINGDKTKMLAPLIFLSFSLKKGAN